MEGETLISEDEIFNRSGPYHLTDIDWNNQYHRTSVAASLVQGVYILEKDRQKDRTEPSISQAKDWWESFHFSLYTCVCDDHDSITAAIFEYDDQNTHHSGIPPRYVIAFRGTILKRATWLEDVLLDIRCVYNHLRGQRWGTIMGEMLRIICLHENKDVWLAGHSLGAGLALLAGKTLARYGYNLESHIFNPPTSSIVLKLLVSKKLKLGVRVVNTLMRAALVKATRADKGEEAESFMKLKAWKPYLYVNPKDLICSECIDYFKQRKQVSDMSLPVSLSAQYTDMNPFSSCRGVGGATSSEPSHILPSAHLMINTTVPPQVPRVHSFGPIWRDRRVLAKRVIFAKTRLVLYERVGIDKRLKAHQIRQWWDPNNIVKCESFQLQDSASSSQ